MAKWRFWANRESSAPEFIDRTTPPPVATRARGFSPPPPRRKGGLAAELNSDDPVISRKLARHEQIERQLEEAELAAQRENPWTERVRLIDEAVAGLDTELKKPVERVDRVLPALPAWPLTVVEIRPQSPARVVFESGGHHFPFSEEIDWAERGHTVVRGELLLESDELLDTSRELGLDIDATDRLSDALFALATDVRDAALEGRSGPRIDSFDQLLESCPVCGDIQMWNGVCLSCVNRKARLARLEGERQRLFLDRDAVMAERAAKVDQLPILRKKFAESAAELRTK
ncbi:MAG: hypothetical protein AB7V46_16745 [Thermomicrobiales bacterium]